MEQGNAKEFTPAHGAFAAVGRERGLTRQAIKAAYDKGNADIVEAVIRHSINQLNSQKNKLLALAESIKEGLK